MLPVGMTIAAGAVTLGGAQAANWSCTAAAQTVTCTSATAIAAAGASVFTFTPGISAGTTGTLTNRAQVGGGGDPTNPLAPTPATAGACTGTDAPTEGCAIDGPDTVSVLANLSITKTDGVNTVNAGATTTYTIVVSNAGPANANGAIFTDGAVANLNVTSVTCGSAAGGAACPAPAGVTVAAMQGAGITIATLPAGGSVTFSVTGTAGASGTIANVANIGAPAGVTDPIPGNNSATDTNTIQPVADLAISKTGPATVNSNGAVSYSVVVTNNGPSSANNAVFTDPAVANLNITSVACGSATNGAACPVPASTTVALMQGAGIVVPTLPNTGSVTFTVSGTVAGSGNIANIASIAPPAGTNDNTAGNNSSTANTMINALVDLALTKTSASTFTVGGNASFTLTPNNSIGFGASSGTITVVDTLPTGLTYVAAGSGGISWTCGNAGQVVTCTSSAVIAAGATGNPIAINVTVGSNAVPSVTNTANISGGNEPASNSGNNSAVLMVPVSNMAVNTFLTDGAQTGLPGTSVLYTHVFNAGIAGSVSFASTDLATPATPGWGVQIYRDANCNGMLDGAEGAAVIGGSVNVVPGDQVCLIVKSNIPAAAPYNSQDSITVSATFTPTAGANTVYTRQDITTVGAAGGAGLVLAKSVRNVTQGGTVGTSNTAKPGEVLEYIITYTNNASAPVSMIVISDNTPAFTTFTVASCGAPTPAALTACAVTVQPSIGGAGNIQWTLTGSLNAAQSGTVIFRVTVQ